jgi:hypothetical protein
MLSRSEAAYVQRRQDAGCLVIGYASGTPTHDRDFALVKPALKNILRRYPQAEAWIIGPLNPGSDWGSLAGRIRQFPLISWRELPEYLARFDINLAPLVMDNPFAQSKSEIKYMEAALVRVPTIASPTNAYQFAINNGENGFLAASDSEWEQALTLLIEQADDRIEVGEAAYTNVLQNYHPQRRAVELVSTLDQISLHLRGALFRSQDLNDPSADMAGITPALPQNFSIDPEIERNPTLLTRAIYTLRYRGIRTLLFQVWTYFRRILAPVFPFRSTRK